MKRTLIAFLLIALCSVSALAQTEIAPPADGSGGGESNFSSGESNLYYHGGSLLPNAKVVYIFWGDVSPVYAKDLQYYRGVYGGMGSHMGMLAQYSTPQGSLVGSQADIFDPATPPVAVSTRQVEDEIVKWFAGRYNSSTIYTVILPPGHYLDIYNDGFSTTCGSAHPNTCATHWAYRDPLGSGIYVKFSVIGYPDCSTCWHSAPDANGVMVPANDSQNAEIALIRVTRGAMTDPLPGYGWLDSGIAGTGYGELEGDEKCQAAVFRRIVPGGPYDTGSYYPIQTFYFQRTWSNASGTCVE